MKYSHTVAHFISWMFLPFVVPVYGLYITLYTAAEPIGISEVNMYDLPVEVKEKIISVFIIISVIAPAISFYSLKKSGLISSIEMDKREERYIPIMIMIIYCLLIVAFFIYKVPDSIVLPHYLISLPLSGAIIAGLFAYLNKFYKLSLHTGGMGILVGYLVAFNANHLYSDPTFVVIAIIISGFVASARLFLQKHNLKEVFFGWIIAVLISFITNLFYENFQTFVF
jgi:hypothetical protein